MKVTVCELPDSLTEQVWHNLVNHVLAESSDFLLLPELPFFPWMMAEGPADPQTWRHAVRAHDRWMEHFNELASISIAGTRPIEDEELRYNEGFIWDLDNGAKGIHRKAFLPSEDGWQEATWYRRAEPQFQAVDHRDAKIGFLICTEMWYGQYAQEYARQGIHLLLSPRATPLSSAEKWVFGGQTAALVSGAYCLASNRTGLSGRIEWGSHGWIIDPEGEVLGLTSAETPFITREVDLKIAEEAKKEYPRYIYAETNS